MAAISAASEAADAISRRVRGLYLGNRAAVVNESGLVQKVRGYFQTVIFFFACKDFYQRQKRQKR